MAYQISSCAARM